MRTRKLASAVGALALTVAGVLAFTSPAHATGEQPSVTRVDADCGVDLTFTNPTRWPFSFDYRLDDEDQSAPVEDDLKDLTIKEGPRAGSPFEPRYRVVSVPDGGSETVEVRFDTAGVHKVEYWLNRGPEQRMFLSTVSVDVDVPESCEPVADPEVLFTAATCEKSAASVTVTNPNKRKSLSVAFNDAEASEVKPGESVGVEFDKGSVQVHVGGEPFGDPYVYAAPDGCEKPGPGVPPAGDGGDGGQGAGGGLPVTGVAGPVLVGVAAALLLLGTAAVVWARRRRRLRFVA